MTISKRDINNNNDGDDNIDINDRPRKRIQQEQQTQQDDWISIDIEKLDNVGFDEIKNIANSLSVVISDTKEKTIKRIKRIIKYRKEYIRNQQYQNQLNPFNNDYKELLKLEGMNEQIEIPFWKVFRNKFIFNCIFSNIDSNSHIKYDSIISVLEMVSNKRVSMLRDKVIRNKHLNLLGYECIYKEFHGDKEFYQSFFKNYLNQIRKSVKEWVNEVYKIIIESRCLSAFQVLVEEYVLVPTIDCLTYSCKYLALEFIEYLIQPKFDLISLTSPIGKPHQISIHNVLNSFSNIDSVSNQFFDCLNLFIELIGKQFTIDQLKHKLVFGKNLFKIGLLLKNLILACDILDYGKADDDSSTPGMAHKFSDQQLNSTLDNPINYNSNKKEDIKSLLNIYYLEENEEIKSLQLQKELEYYLLYGNLNNIKPGRNESIKRTYIQRSLEYGNYQILEMGIKFRWNYTFKIDKSEFTGLFSKLLSNTTESRYQFIKSLATLLKRNFSKFPESFNCFSIILEYDDLELIQLFVDQFKDPLSLMPSRYDNYKDFKIMENIKSTQVLDYIFNKFNQQFDTQEMSLSFWYCIHNMDIFNHLDNLIVAPTHQPRPRYYSTIVVDFVYVDIKCQKQMLSFLKVLITKYNSNYQIHIKIDDCTQMKRNFYSVSKFCIWLNIFFNSDYQIISKRIKGISELLFHYLAGNYQQFINQCYKSSNQEILQVIVIICDIGDINIISLLLDNIKSTMMQHNDNISTMCLFICSLSNK